MRINTEAESVMRSIIPIPFKKVTYRKWAYCCLTLECIEGWNTRYYTKGYIRKNKKKLFTHTMYRDCQTWNKAGRFVYA